MNLTIRAELSRTCDKELKRKCLEKSFYNKKIIYLSYTYTYECITRKNP